MTFESADWHDAETADALALASSIIRALLDNPDGPRARELISSIISDLARDVPDGPPEEIIEVLGRRGAHVAITVEAMAHIVVDVIHGAERAGLTINLEAVASPLDILATLEDPFPEGQ